MKQTTTKNTNKKAIKWKKPMQTQSDTHWNNQGVRPGYPDNDN